jgi:hypothetical protein
MPARPHHRPSARLAAAVAASFLALGALTATASAASAETVDPVSTAPAVSTVPALSSAPDASPLAAAPVVTTTTIDTPTELTFGEATELHVSVETADGSVADGTVFLTMSGNTFGQGFALVDGAVDIVIGGESNGVITPHVLAAQSWEFVATFQPADAAAFAPSSSSVVVDIAKRISETRVSVDRQPRVGQQAYLLITVTGAEEPSALPGTPKPFGNAILYRDGVPIAEVSLDLAGTAAVPFTPTEEGVSEYGAVFLGGISYSGSVGANVAVRVIAAPAPPAPTPAPAAAPTSSGDGRAALANTGSDATMPLGMAALLGLGGVLLLAGRAWRRSSPRS